MNPFELGNMGGLLANFNQKMDAIKQQAATTQVTGSAGGGVVTVQVTCDYQCTDVHIDPQAATDAAMLEDLVRAATNEALRKAREATKQAMGELAAGLPIPPGLLGM